MLDDNGNLRLFDNVPTKKDVAAHFNILYLLKDLIKQYSVIQPFQ